jgi:hypothetical protein
MDTVVDAEVDRAVEQVRGNADLWSTFLSGWSPVQAETLTREVATTAFASPGFRTAVDTLAAAVAADAAAEMAALSAESASLATLCLQQYIGGRYSDAIVAAFTTELQNQTATLDFTVTDDAGSGILAVIDRHKTALGGVGVIIAAQIARRVVVKIGQTISKRVAGRVVGRVIGKAGSTVIPVAGWAIGAALILYDVYDSRDGALPQIQEGLKAAEVKTTVRDEIAASVDTELRLEMPQLGREIANDLYASWLDFQRKYRRVLEFADAHPAFQPLLAQATDLGSLATLVDTGLAAVGEDGMAAALGDGTLARASDLPEAAYAILAATGDFAPLLAWADVAGSRVEDVARLELYKHQTPQTWTRDRLLALLAVDDPTALANLALLDPAALDTLLGLSTEHLRTLARTLPADDLAWLAGYLATLEQDQTNQLVAFLLAEPERIAQLDDPAVQAQVAAGDDVAATLRFLAAPVTLPGFAEDLLRLAAGDVRLGLFRAKYGLPVTAGTIAIPLLLLLALVQTLLAWLLAPVTALARGARALSRRPSQPGPR